MTIQQKLRLGTNIAVVFMGLLALTMLLSLWALFQSHNWIPAGITFGACFVINLAMTIISEKP